MSSRSYYNPYLEVLTLSASAKFEGLIRVIGLAIAEFGFIQSPRTHRLSVGHCCNVYKRIPDFGLLLPIMSANSSVQPIIYKPKGFEHLPPLQTASLADFLFASPHAQIDDSPAFVDALSGTKLSRKELYDLCLRLGKGLDALGVTRKNGAAQKDVAMIFRCVHGRAPSGSDPPSDWADGVATPGSRIGPQARLSTSPSLRELFAANTRENELLVDPKIRRSLIARICSRSSGFDSRANCSRPSVVINHIGSIFGEHVYIIS